MDSPNPHPIGTLAYWQHSLADYEQRAARATAEGFPIRARGFRDDAAEIRTIIERVRAGVGATRYAKPEGTTEEDLGFYHKPEGLPEQTIGASDIGAQALQVPEAKPRNGANFKSCINCGKPHQGAGWRCRDCKTAYRDAGDWAKKEKERKKQRNWYAKRLHKKKAPE